MAKFWRRLELVSIQFENKGKDGWIYFILWCNTPHVYQIDWTRKIIFNSTNVINFMYWFKMNLEENLWNESRPRSKSRLVRSVLNGIVYYCSFYSYNLKKHSTSLPYLFKVVDSLGTGQYFNIENKIKL